MRVLCIDSKLRVSDYPFTPMVKEGITYHTTATCNGYGRDGSIAMSYKLKEFSHTFCFDCDRFIPLSDNIDTEVTVIPEKMELAEL